jgi:thiol-disulfide isomerase/thioredoxin
MVMLRVLAASALLVIALAVRPAWGQVTMTPESPRWGDTITITADPSAPISEPERFFKSDRLYALLYAHHQGGLDVRQRLSAPMTWDGRQFVAHLKLPHGCETAYVAVATAEQYVTSSRPSFVCRRPDGSLPPGARISGLIWGGRDTSQWKTDIAADLAALRDVPDHGWEHHLVWLFSWQDGRTPPQERLRQVERLEQEERAHATPALLAALVAGYSRAREVPRAFAILKELCARFPESEQTVKLGLRAASAAVVNNPEFEPELNALLAGVAKAAPRNKALRQMLFRLVTDAPDVPLSIIRTVADGWIADQPDFPEPRLLLAEALVKSGASAAAETEVSKAIELYMQPRPFDFSEQRDRPRALRLRARLRAERGDVVGALTDARLAQLVAPDKVGADDLAVEAELWQRLGFGRKAEDLAAEAYQKGSLKAEAFMKEAYVARTGSDAGFGDYLIGRLRGSTDSPARALAPVPAFSATTLEGTKIDRESLQGKLTVVDFWFITCPPCRAERPKLNDIVAEFGDRVRFIGFALDAPDALRTYLQQTPFKYEIVPESEPIARAFGVKSYPSHMILDGSGNIVWLAGSEEDRIERLRAMIFRTLARAPR